MDKNNLRRSVITLVCCLSLVVSASAVDTANAQTIYTPQKVSEDEFFAPSPELTKEQNQQIIDNAPNVQVVGEFDSLLEKKAEAAALLASDTTDAYARAEAQAVLDADPADRVKELQSLSDSELETMGMDDDRIEIIRNFTGSEAELRALQATCSIALYNTKYSKVGNKNWAKMSTSFSWDKAPFWDYKDCIVMGGSSTFSAQPVSDSYCKINYEATSRPELSTIVQTYGKSDLKISPFNVNNSGFSFSQTIAKVINGEGVVYRAMWGYATMAFMSSDDHGVTLSGAYGHAKRNVTASLGIDFSKTAPVGISIGLTEKTYDITADTATPYTFPS